jgi:alkanesulfonate monooxygenase SsuD/methylene tetrahydromethanopterin reductase-like flavin-dependent oxidoreductase (luciferase family)
MTIRPIRIGVQLEPQHADYKAIRSAVAVTRTVDHISDGRLILGIRSGWAERDYAGYGYEFGTPGTRIDHLGESLNLIESRFGKLNPAPSRKIPVLIGGGGEKRMLRLVAEHADVRHGPETSRQPGANW